MRRGGAPPGIPPGGAPPGLSSAKGPRGAPPPAIRSAGEKRTAAGAGAGSGEGGEGEGIGRRKQLTAGQLEEIKEGFSMFDRDSDGYISTKEIGVLMMSLGMSPTRKELEDVMKKVRPSKRGHVSLPEFMDIVKSDQRKTSSGEEIMEGFKIYDQMMSRKRDNGKIEVKELRQVMTTFGERLNKDEIDGMVKFAEDCTFGGEINYVRFVDKMMNPNKYRGKPAI